MMAWASGVWRAISSSVISSDMPFMLGKTAPVARPIPKKPHPGPWPITDQLARVTSIPTIEVVLAGGQCVRVTPGFDPAALRQLLTVLQEGGPC